MHKMEQRIKNLFTEEILHESIHRFEINETDLQALDAFESFIFEFKNISGEYILRISHSHRRSEDLIQGEVDWINYLADRAIPVSRAVPSKNGKLVEVVSDQNGGNFLATAFAKAKGSSPWGKWTPELYQKYGEMIGKMHTATKNFQPIKPERKRPEWDAPIFDYVNAALPEQEFLVREKYELTCKEVNKISKNQDTYGLIHQDAHGGNLFIDDEVQITLFDFDDCCYSWFINDIAIVLFNIVMGQQDWESFTREFMTNFLRGYLKHCSLNLDLLDQIPHFLKIREMELYAVIQRDFGSENIEDEWCSRYMKDRKYKIENDIPYIDFDFNSLRSSL